MNGKFRFLLVGVIVIVLAVAGIAAAMSLRSSPSSRDPHTYQNTRCYLTDTHDAAEDREEADTDINDEEPETKLVCPRKK